MKKEETVRVMVCRTGKAEIKEIPNTLKAFQKLVGGPIEVFKAFPDRDLVTLCNEEGYLRNMLPNPYFVGIVGTVVVCGKRGEEFASLTDAQVSTLKRLLWRC